MSIQELQHAVRNAVSVKLGKDPEARTISDIKLAIEKIAKENVRLDGEIEVLKKK